MLVLQSDAVLKAVAYVQVICLPLIIVLAIFLHQLLRWYLVELSPEERRITDDTACRETFWQLVYKKLTPEWIEYALSIAFAIYVGVLDVIVVIFYMSGIVALYAEFITVALLITLAAIAVAVWKVSHRVSTLVLPLSAAMDETLQAYADF